MDCRVRSIFAGYNNYFSNSSYFDEKTKLETEYSFQKLKLKSLDSNKVYFKMINKRFMLKEFTPIFDLELKLIMPFCSKLGNGKICGPPRFALIIHIYHHHSLGLHGLLF